MREVVVVVVSPTEDHESKKKKHKKKPTNSSFLVFFFLEVDNNFSVHSWKNSVQMWMRSILLHRHKVINRQHCSGKVSFWVSLEFESRKYVVLETLYVVVYFKSRGQLFNDRI